MNFNKNLVYLSSKYLKASQLFLIHQYPRNFHLLRKPGYNRRYLYLLLDKLSESKKLSPHKLPVCLYSVAGEELVNQKESENVIKVPSVHFEDVAFDKAVSHSELCNALQKCDSLEEQMHILTSTLALSVEDVQKRIKFCKTLESLIKPFFGDIRIQMFGSTVNGYGFKGCDVDMSFETFSEVKDRITYLEVPDVPLVNEVLCGKVSLTELAQLPPKEQLLFIHTVLLEYYRETNEPIIFINAHIPLVRFYHDKYKLKCDLTVRNKIAFSNTKLLYLFGKLDPRVLPLMMTIRYWAKHVELIGKGLMFNTYTISLIVIHFLQTRNPPILPSAQEILLISDSLTIEDMFDMSFLEITKKIPPSENKQTLDDLLREFFLYYLFFDWTRVICPLIGGSISREEFFTEQTSRRFRMNTICVQDPMLPVHNVAELVHYKMCRRLNTELMAACTIFSKDCNTSPNSTCKWGLLTLLDRPEEYNPANAPRNHFFTVPLLSKEQSSKDPKLYTAESVLHLLKHALLFEAHVLSDGAVEEVLKQYDLEVQKTQQSLAAFHHQEAEVFGEARKRRVDQWLDSLRIFKDKPMLEDFQEFSRNHKLILSAKCKVSRNTWLGRQFVKLDSLPSSDAIEREHSVSLKVAKLNEQNAVHGKTKPFFFLYECYESSDDSLLVNCRPLQRTNVNLILGLFLKDYVPKLVRDSFR